ncbi:hypothetical protein LJB85_00275 [Porphyromonadaceae bacterium OttesenSCG-928-L07]|nr:hypothetical protein [Porphyromonadaceae bacterium OttesenSCG-928-L07]MDL2251652.1 hypothetical protein [Odoribacter sp. OttesenSCG-928-J03]
MSEMENNNIEIPEEEIQPVNIDLEVEEIVVEEIVSEMTTEEMSREVQPEPVEEKKTVQLQEDSDKKKLIIDHRLIAGKLAVYDWLHDLPDDNYPSDVVEVRFKNTRKAFFSNPSQLTLKPGDIVAVEAALGHDIGIVSLTGKLVNEQMRLKRIDLNKNPLKKIYRKAKPHDIEKWQQAIALEYETMLKSRIIASDLRLNMKIGDVEYQGDKTKAIFYYIAEDRVDFRTLIKILAETFHIRVEMKQIGTRQEAGRIGGIGPCGRGLCCSTFITNFVSVSTSSARYQDISLNPQKLAGQCGKLKCCLNYEVDAYIDEQKDFPSTNIPLNTGEGMLYHQKTDIFGRTMQYSFDKEGRGIQIKLPVERVKKIIAMNRKGTIPPKANDEVQNQSEQPIGYTDGVGEESLNRFDDKKQKKQRPKNRNRGKREGQRPEGDRANRENKENKENRGRRDNKENRERRPERPEKNKE